MFRCRCKELSDLNKRYSSDNFECIVIYGRRRVGKTALINEFCRDKPTVFFSALNASSNENLEALSKAVFQKINPEAISSPVYRSFDDVFDEITRLSENERLIFVIDEYPYLAGSDKSISSRLQHMIDRKWKDGRLFLILCGSSMSFMEHQVLGYESPLYGRRTGQYKLLPLDYRETAEFNPSLTCEQQALVYGITGGIPHYINKLNAGTDIDEAVKENLFNTSSYLFEEPQNLLKQELREPAIYNSVIAAVAAGATRSNEIAAKVGLDATVCAKYIKVLTELGIMIKNTPITEKPGKKTIYSIGDNFFRFWYRFVPQNMSSVCAGRIDRIYDYTIKKYYSEYMGHIFEQMCRDYLFLYDENMPIVLSDIGSWWGTDAKQKKEVEIDIVGTSVEGNEYLIGSCKYRNETVGVDEFELLKQYASVFGKGEKYHYYIFSKSGFAEGLKKHAEKGEVMLVTLADMYR